ncbi:FadR/GntR family transcriptional regulator [Desulfobaculum sp. SPO524]|uniref:FadR/GntR family transcriptional regulator n=1 Tax=Desulfobaculum sp. SPO524 TaxID=3378071 RepID=UPI003854898B
MSEKSTVEVKVRSATRCDDIVASLKQDILLQKYVPGDLLPKEEELAHSFGVSRPMVREALSILKTKGYLISKRGKNGGTFVQNVVESKEMGSVFEDLILMGRMKIEHLLSARLLIEPEVARLATMNATTTDLQHLSDLNEKVATGDDLAEKTDNNIAFHVYLGKLSGNPFYEVSIRSFMNFTRMFSEMVEFTEPYVHNDKAHKEIFQAMMRRDPHLAFERMFVHVSSMKNALTSQEHLYRDVHFS